MTDWKKIAKDKADSVLALIPQEWRLPSIPSIEEQRDVTGLFIQQFLSPLEIEITEADAVNILKKTTTGAWSAVEVAKAFCHRAAIAHQLLNCLHEIFFDAAIADAQKLDEYYAQHKKPIGLLHGLPVSLKDQFHVKDVETHMGYVGWIGTFQGLKGTGKEKKFESELVRELRSQGATLYCKTSVPHTLMCGETTNNIIGYTYNAKNRNLSCGGSSGGEGALIAARGSPVGFGTDIGGSVRIPAAFNGLFGLRPSTGRIPYEGAANTIDGQNNVLSVIGPLATSADTLQLVFQAVLSTQPWLHDPLCLNIPWRDDAARAISDPVQRMHNGLSFAVLRHDGYCSLTPPVSRALSTTIATVQALGHQVIDWTPPVSHDAVRDLIAKCWFADGGADLRSSFELSGEEPSSSVIVTDGPQMRADEMMAVSVAKRVMQKEYMEYWNSTAALTNTGRPVDAIIAPVAPFPAARPGLFKYYTYSMWVNMFDYTSVVVPVTKVDKNIDLKLQDFKPCNDMDQEVQDTYDPDIYDGAYVGLQLVGRRLEEEKMIALAKYVSEALPSQQ